MLEILLFPLSIFNDGNNVVGRLVEWEGGGDGPIV